MNATVRDTVFAAAMLAINGLLWLEMRRPKYQDAQEQDYGFNPAFFPRILLLLWTLLAVVILVRALLSPSAQVEAPLWHRYFAAVVLTFAYLVAMGQVGFVFATIPFCGLFLYGFGYRHWLLMPLIAVVFPIVTWWVFVYPLQIPLPTSPWFSRL